LLEIAVCARWYPKLQNPVISCAQGFDSKYIQTHRYIAAAMQKAVVFKRAGAGRIAIDDSSELLKHKWVFL